MRYFRVLITTLLMIPVFWTPLKAREMKPGEFLVLVYHAVVEKPDDIYSVSRKAFVEHLEYLRTHGFHPVSIEDILKVKEGRGDLPPKPVLLAFDDGYISYYDFVVPLLREYGYPSVLAISGDMINNPPQDIPEPLMTWKQLKELSSESLVEIVSHSYSSHKSVQYNSWGNVGPAMSVRLYDPLKKRYESEDEYIKRIERDFEEQERLFMEKLGYKPRAIVWPYGEYTGISRDIAIKRGYKMIFTSLSGYGRIDELYEVKRNFIINEPIDEFIETVNQTRKYRPYVRAVQVDLDLIYDPESYEKTDQNLGKLIDRLVEMKVNTVFLQAFSDPDGTGNIESVYFPNRVLPMKADLFSHAVHQIKIRNIDVYAWMPVLSIVLPDRKLSKSLEVVSRGEKSWYKRLSPFSEKARETVRMLYEDLAAHCMIQGILFQDDAYLTDEEDFHTSALEKYRATGIDIEKIDREEELWKWTRYKTEALIDFTNYLMEGVRRYRPDAKSARNIYAMPVLNPESEKWFAQNYSLFLKNYDYVVVMAYPWMEDVKEPSKWLIRLVKTVKSEPRGVDKTIFKLQAYDWRNKRPVDSRELLSLMRDVLATGGIHLAYYPDNLWEDSPELKVIKLEMSTRRYPFLP